MVEEKVKETYFSESQEIKDKVLWKLSGKQGRKKST